MWAIRVCLAISILAAGAVLGFRQHEYTQSEIEAAKQQYAANCARCHGPDGDALANADIGTANSAVQHPTMSLSALSGTVYQKPQWRQQTTYRNPMRQPSWRTCAPWPRP